MQLSAARVFSPFFSSGPNKLARAPHANHVLLLPFKGSVSHSFVSLLNEPRRTSCHLPVTSCQLPVAPCSDKFNNVTGLAPYVRDRKVFRLASRIRQTFQNEIMSGQRSGRKKCKQIWPSGNRDKHTRTHTQLGHVLRVCLPTNTYEITCTHVPGQGAAVCCPVYRGQWDSGTVGQWDNGTLPGVTFDIIKFF